MWGDKEKENGLKVSAACCRGSVNEIKVQLGFIENVTFPILDVLIESGAVRSDSLQSNGEHNISIREQELKDNLERNTGKLRKLEKKSSKLPAV
ncbi:hypothetical protein ACOME3_009697 [Neoechinorhynchus agilis]